MPQSRRQNIRLEPFLAAAWQAKSIPVFGGGPFQAVQKSRFRLAREGVCEGVGKRSFVRPILTKAFGKKDCFPTGDGDEKRNQSRKDTRVG